MITKPNYSNPLYVVYIFRFGYSVITAKIGEAANKNPSQGKTCEGLNFREVSSGFEPL